MRKLIKEVLFELKLVFTGKSMDLLLPPVLFLVLQSLFTLTTALIGSLILGLFFFVKRLYDKSNLLYALGGLVGVVLAISLSLLNSNANNFFIPDIVGTSILLLTAVGSLLIKKPLAIFVSHITRGWELDWFFRKDVYPAYKEVTILWVIFFVLRLTTEVWLYFNGSTEELAVANIVMGYPVLIIVLTISYIYGITKLKKLKGPGVDEYRDNVQPPWRGQNRGF